MMRHLSSHYLLGLRIAAWILLVIVFVSGLGGAGLYLYLNPKLPDVDSLRDIQLQIPMRVYSADGRLIGEFGEMRRTPLAIADTPPLMIQAILAAEDDRFFKHKGVDITGLLRAVWELAMHQRIRTGGSTITMQVAKNYFLSPERTFSRKFTEILLALKIESRLTKPEILELYLNKIFLGHRAYGVQAAAHIYYGKDIRELSLAELAMIASLPKAPSSFNPLTNPERALQRRNWILQRMEDLDYITTEQRALAQATPDTARHHGARIDVDAPYIAEMARQEVIARYGLGAYTNGFSVYTTVDSHLQQEAQEALRRGLHAYDWRHGYRPTVALPAVEGNADATRQRWLDTLRKTPTIADLVPAVVTALDERSATCLLADGQSITLNWEQGLSSARLYRNVDRIGPEPKQASDILAVGQIIRLQPTETGGWRLSQIPRAQAALVSLSPRNGAILALSGGYSFQQSKFNRATQALRQPGSSFKPFLYASALDHGFTTASIINDAPVVFDDTSLEDSWRPENSTGQFHGPTTLRDALVNSRNLVSIRLLRAIGIDTMIAYSNRFGFDTQALPRDLSLALGSHAVPPMTIATGYAVLANGGYRVQPWLISHIDDSSGKRLFEARPATVCDPCSSDEENTYPAAERVMEASTVYLVDSMLQDVIRKGTARRALTLNRQDMAGKTGTTNGPTDAWFAGYTPDVVTTVWLGFDQNQSLGRAEYGGTAALPIWIDFMKVALEGREDKPRHQPAGLVTVRIDPATGLRATASQEAVFEWFKEGTEPHTSSAEGIPAGQPAPWDLF